MTGRDVPGSRSSPTLIPVAPVRMRPFQGWRYLEADAAPADIARHDATGLDVLPQEVFRELRALCLV